MGFLKSVFGNISGKQAEEPRAFVRSQGAPKSIIFRKRILENIEDEKRDLGPGELTTIETMFLIKLKKKPVSEISEEQWEPIIGSVKKKWSYLLNDGFIENKY